MKMVALDLDGTLLRSDKSISPRTLRVLHLLRCRGVEIAIATARPPRAVMSLLPEQLQNITLICYNGAEIHHAGRLIHRQYILPDDVSSIVQAIGYDESVRMIAVECEDVFYSRGEVEAFFPGLPAESLDSLDLDNQPAAKVLLGLSKHARVQDLRDRLPNECIMTVTDEETLCQIMHRDVDKVNAIRLVAGLHGYSLAEVVAFGDDHNDMEMVTKCGLGVAMGNAVPELKQIADLVTSTNDQDGVAYVLEGIVGEAEPKHASEVS